MAVAQALLEPAASTKTPHADPKAIYSNLQIFELAAEEYENSGIQECCWGKGAPPTAAAYDKYTSNSCLKGRSASTRR
jgi:hypothetical protein